MADFGVHPRQPSPRAHYPIQTHIRAQQALALAAAGLEKEVRPGRNGTVSLLKTRSGRGTKLSSTTLPWHSAPLAVNRVGERAHGHPSVPRRPVASQQHGHEAGRLTILEAAQIELVGARLRARR